MTYQEINSILAERFPELSVAIKNEESFWKYEDVPSYCLYGSVVEPFIAKLLTEETNIPLIKRFFDFFEEMSNCNDEEVKNLVQVSILESLWGNSEILNTAHKYMHPQTRMLCDELRKWFKKDGAALLSPLKNHTCRNHIFQNDCRFVHSQIFRKGSFG
jgi:hypothetical protein